MKLITAASKSFLHNSLEHQPYSLQCNTSLQVGSQGGLLLLPSDKVDSYLEDLVSSTSQNLQFTFGVLGLQRAIYSDPVLKFYWQNGIEISNNLKGKTAKQVLEMINAVLHIPPAFNKSEFIGFPINAIFLDFMQTKIGRNFFSNQKINLSMKEILKQYAQMVSSPFSVLHLHDQQPKGWFCQTAHKLVNYQQFAQYNLNAPHFGFESWNAWFLRTFKSNMRPIGAETPPSVDPQNVIVNSCQSTPLAQPHQPVRDVMKNDKFWLKDNRYSLSEIFSSHGIEKGYPDLFMGGTVYQAYLSPWNYHHWHAPVDGQIVDIYSICGTYYLTQSQYLDHYDPLAPNGSQAFLSTAAARMVFLIKADNPKIGYVSIIYIGMTEISSCVASRSIGEKVKKGEHIGHFAYGGSSHAMVFQRSSQLSFNKSLYETQKGAKKAVTQKLSAYLAHVS